MQDRNQLTPKQLKVLKFIEQEVARTGQTPTFRAIAQHFEWSAVGTVQSYVTKLIELGFLDKPKGQSRGIRLPYQEPVTWIPILGTVPAGKPTEALEDVQGSLVISGLWKNRGQLFALRVKGESMIGKGILAGDYVIVRSQADAESGDVVVVMVENEATVKTLEKAAGKIRLLPANPEFKPIDLKPDRNHRIVGKVIGLQRSYSVRN